ncbi:hypothetical protein [Shinella sp. M27]|uniref:hypothetical protein n=1 Tax=Shinella sp. M27 TaxID=3368614 RepID=UPI003B9F3E97
MAKPYNVTPQMIRDTAGWEHIDEELRSMLRVAADALDASEAELKGRGPSWRCFHCDEVFTTEHAARLHFGETECQDPACQIKAGAEMSMLEALRRAEEEARKAVIAMHEEGTDGWTAFRRLEGRTRQNAEAAENLGYERGLRDGRAEAPQLFGPYAHLNGHRALSEDSWTVEDDPISNDVEYFSIPLFAKVDVKFPVTYGEPDAAAYEAYADELRALATNATGSSSTDGGKHGG